MGITKFVPQKKSSFGSVQPSNISDGDLKDALVEWEKVVPDEFKNILGARDV